MSSPPDGVSATTSLACASRPRRPCGGSHTRLRTSVRAAALSRALLLRLAVERAALERALERLARRERVLLRTLRAFDAAPPASSPPSLSGSHPAPVPGDAAPLPPSSLAPPDDALVPPPAPPPGLRSAALSDPLDAPRASPASCDGVASPAPDVAPFCLPCPDWTLATPLEGIGTLLYLEYRAADFSFAPAGPPTPEVATEVIALLASAASRYDMRTVLDLPSAERDCFPHLFSLVVLGLLDPAPEVVVADRLTRNLIARRRRDLDLLCATARDLCALPDPSARRLGEFIASLLDPTVEA